MHIELTWLSSISLSPARKNSHHRSRWQHHGNDVEVRQNQLSFHRVYVPLEYKYHQADVRRRTYHWFTRDSYRWFVWRPFITFNATEYKISTFQMPRPPCATKISSLIYGVHHRSSTGTRLRPFNLDFCFDCAATGVRALSIIRVQQDWIWIWWHPDVQRQYKVHCDSNVLVGIQKSDVMGWRDLCAADSILSGTL